MEQSSNDISLMVGYINWSIRKEMLLKKKKENLGARKWPRFCVHDEGKRQHADDTLIIHQDLKFM